MSKVVAPACIIIIIIIILLLLHQRNPGCSPDPPQDFKFPPMRVNQSLARLDLDTLIMRSSARPADEAGSSLDGSTYDVLGDSLLETSDDEAHTESIASTDGPTPDNASEFSDDDFNYPMGDKDLQDSFHSSQAENADNHMDVLSIGSGQDSTLTERAAGLDRSGSMWIRLDEQPMQEDGVTQGSEVFISKPDANGELHKVLEVYGCAQIRMLVKAALAPQYASTPDTYRILYIGKPDKWIEDLITEHIGKALTASPHPSKSVMVRGQIEPYSPIMHRLRCVELHTFAAHEKPSHVLAILEDGQELKLGRGLRSAPDNRPDLVIFCHAASMGNTDARDYAAAGNVFQREGIACINLTTARPYGAGATSFDPRMLRVHVEGSNDGDTEYELKEVLPLDYYTFVHLEPSQLNRHLALMSPNLLSTPHARGESRLLFPRQEKNSITFDFLASIWPILKPWLKAILLCTLLPAVFLGIAYGPMFYQMSSNWTAEVDSSSQAFPLSSTIVQTIPTSSSLPVASVSTAKPLSTGPSAIPSPAKSAKKPSAKQKKPSKDHSFHILGMGDHQFILAPKGSFKASKNKPQIQINVSRENQPIAIRYNRTINGDYIVDLESEYPKSNFTVKIATYSKPLLRQSFEITLGHNKSRLQQVLGTAMNNLQGLSSSAVQQMQAQLARLEAANTPKEQVAAYIQDARQAVQAQVSTGTERLKQAQGAAWTGLRQATAPVRTSPTVLKARKNALRLRCKLETATGLRVKGSKDAESWACAKVRDMA
ncbi:hypothetical protein IAQ61_007561 [Plenodomus lingam]|uniref:uncharacterized protein n=1 Tax=Leptosphaeria maculans TaxID=5022 RepID=UPI00331837BB|nr:hypothetical protein IAQ61_007561 [Plenodomus lingam]